MDSSASPATKRKPNTGEDGEEAAAGSAGPSTSSDKKSNHNAHQPDGSSFECNICLDTAKEPVISMCGHLFW